MPPIAVCPQVDNKKTVRCLAISKMQPDRIVSCGEIKPKSKICISLHAYLAEYDESLTILTTSACMQSPDSGGVLIDWARTADPRTIGRIRIPIINAFLGLANTILNGRITCDIAKYVIEKKDVNEKDIIVVGFLGGTQFLSPMADYCRQKYGIRFNHMVGELIEVCFQGILGINEISISFPSN